MSLPMQKARYTAQAIGVSFGISSNNNNQIAIGFEIVDNPEFGGETITWIGHFTDKTAERTIESLQHAGWQGDDLSDLAERSESDIRAILPTVVQLVCEPEEYDGETRLRVQWVNRLGGGRFAFKDQLEGGALKTFAAQMRGTVRSMRGPGASRPAPPAQRPVPPASRPAATQHSDVSVGRYDDRGDDLPF